jgi:hypothetical protein
LVDTDALVGALSHERIGGAALDVTDPEPLPDGHPLWSLPNRFIAPHTADTDEMCRPLLAGRIRENVERLATGLPLVGTIDPVAGYGTTSPWLSVPGRLPGAATPRPGWTRPAWAPPWSNGKV